MKSLPPIVLTDKDIAGVLLQLPADITDVRHVISLGTPGTPAPPAFDVHPARKIRLEFDDIEVASTLNGYVGPAPEDAEALLQFYREIDIQVPGTVLIHCAAGISRSSAATLLLLAHLLGPGREEAAVQKLLVVHAQTAAAGLRDPEVLIRPNRRLVWLGDQALRRGGALLDACVRVIRTYGRTSWSP